MNKTKNDRVLIIDSLNSYLRIFTSSQHITQDGNFVGGIIGFLRSIGSNIRDFNPTRCILVFDGKGGSTRRRKLYPDYKGNRTGGHGMRMDLFPNKEEEKKEMSRQLRRIGQYLEQLPVEIFVVDNVEADDVIAYLTMQYFKPKGSKVRIVSTDRDFLQLVDGQIEVYSPVKKKLYNPTTLYQEMNLTPIQYLTYRIVSGDTSDNINGIDGIGLKTLLKNFPNLNSIEELVKTSEEKVKEKKPKKVFQTLLEQKDILVRNEQLMQLQETDISGITKVQLFERLENPKSKRTNNFQIRKMIIEDGMTNEFKNLENWLLTTFSGLNVWIT